MASSGFFDLGAADDDGEPHKKPAVAAPAITQDLGPLPVWGWAVVAVAGVFLWRRIFSPKAAAASSGNAIKSVDYPGGGPVFVLPQNPFMANPAAQTPTPAAAQNVPGWLGSPDAVQADYQAKQQQISQLASQLGGDRNAAAKQLGLPYIMGDQLYDPVTNMSIPVQQWLTQMNAQPLYGEALAAGRSAAWIAWAEGQNVLSSPGTYWPGAAGSAPADSVPHPAAA